MLALAFFSLCFLLSPLGADDTQTPLKSPLSTRNSAVFHKVSSLPKTFVMQFDETTCGGTSGDPEYGKPLGEHLLIALSSIVMCFGNDVVCSAGINITANPPRIRTGEDIAVFQCCSLEIELQKNEEGMSFYAISGSQRREIPHVFQEITFKKRRADCLLTVNEKIINHETKKDPKKRDVANDKETTLASNTTNATGTTVASNTTEVSETTEASNTTEATEITDASKTTKALETTVAPNGTETPEEAEVFEKANTTFAPIIDPHKILDMDSISRGTKNLAVKFFQAGFYVLGLVLLSCSICSGCFSCFLFRRKSYASKEKDCEDGSVSGVLRHLKSKRFKVTAEANPQGVPPQQKKEDTAEERTGFFQKWRNGKTKLSCQKDQTDAPLLDEGPK
ncbi:hypothetical protein QR680_013262 [Steinernema hermaphroditum]|uniref:ZP domain-containing protein n=1 Tax=Steinernema hermaphroditum TaxID=289476 RepID=A0AA39M284_9BILA|nr:hypothetical protein QR680_013262 [Steinernema hermaphroditum]